MSFFDFFFISFGVFDKKKENTKMKEHARNLMKTKNDRLILTKLFREIHSCNITVNVRPTQKVHLTQSSGKEDGRRLTLQQIGNFFGLRVQLWVCASTCMHASSLEISTFVEMGPVTGESQDTL